MITLLCTVKWRYCENPTVARKSNHNAESSYFVFVSALIRQSYQPCVPTAVETSYELCYFFLRAVYTLFLSFFFCVQK